MKLYLLKKIEAIVPENNKILGHFLCQGKIDERLTEKYKEMIKESPNAEHIKFFRNNFSLKCMWIFP